MMKNFISIVLLAGLFLSGACRKEDIKSSEKEIIAFTISEQVGESQISSDQSTVNLVALETADLTSVLPTITISPKASVDPASGEPADFSNGPVIYTVTAEDNSTKNWEVAIINALSSEAEITSFSVNGQSGSSVIGDGTVSAMIWYGNDLATLVPEIGISAGASISPNAGIATDFSAGPVLYTVTAADGTEKEWEVTVGFAPNYQRDILSFTVEGQVGETVIENKTVHVEVPFGTDLTSIAPEIEVSYGATISPESGQSVDFSLTGSVTYTVTSESGLSSEWTAYVHYLLIEADNPYYRYTGRIDFSDPKRPRMWAPGTSIEARFTGDYCEVAIYDEVLWGSSQNFFEIVVDGSVHYRVQTSGYENSFRIPDLTDGEHTLTIVKATEAGIGYIEFLGLRCQEVLELPAALDRKLEFIGNSIVCGFGADVSQTACNTGEWYDNNNAYLSYASIVSRDLGAHCHLSSVSGIGMVHSCCDNTYTMPDVFEKINLGTDGADWDFSAYIPDAVIISLGQNDGIQDSTLFCSTYVDFIGTLRSHYPDAYIVCLNSPMGDASLTQALDNYLDGIVGYLNTSGDAKVLKFMVTNGLTSGCDYHPTAAEHEIVASELTPYLQTLLGW